MPARIRPWSMGNLWERRTSKLHKIIDGAVRAAVPYGDEYGHCPVPEELSRSIRSSMQRREPARA